ncbi:DUF488 domain-containing protein [Parafilimonas terrae]|uniref:Uncharacterized conserved protein YeaO, DUF488 family n=1 Tax=Parafilimonas terrae TaxID=1465490 RepID=A0A1I5TQT8_9BACT|nr:DUF488 family protein [Parafilimonas terrae]SFP85393.1 Uncharacterized conserved protein YeaO, DUF488 family [Parafilimonas terrae]
MNIRLKRAYEEKEKTDGFRILVDRLWPRGIKKEDMHVDIWLKDIAPSTVLRKWFNHDAAKWEAFKTKYKAELQQSSALDELKQLIKKHKTVTLVYGAKDEIHSQAAALKELLDKK